MKSTSKTYYHALDHLRALAAFLVFFWHAIHRMGIDSRYTSRLIYYPFVLVFSALSYHFIEKPFLYNRRYYLSEVTNAK